ncbi:MAG: hypothetical protein IPL99_13440 [Candidatus Competibacteraceae bacterium]|nr:hypothetical protein [Candidatus Competibacteraceae bacterium]
MLKIRFFIWLSTKLLDGNCIEASEHRIEVLRTTKSAALPGKSLVVFDPQTELAMNIFPVKTVTHKKDFTE